MVHPLVGKDAPSLSLPGADGETYALTPGAKGVPVALFFYPKSGMYAASFLSWRVSPRTCVLTLCDSATGSFGCTKEACQFRDALAEKDLFKRTKVDIVGISSDPVDKQKAFVDKQKLTVSKPNPLCPRRPCPGLTSTDLVPRAKRCEW